MCIPSVKRYYPKGRPIETFKAQVGIRWRLVLRRPSAVEANAMPSKVRTIDKTTVALEPSCDILEWALPKIPLHFIGVMQ